VDINPALKPTYVDDAQSLAEVPIESYDLILADPPYSIEDANRYQTTMIKRNSVLRALQRVSSGTHIVWLDQVLPMYRKAAFAIDAVIGMVKSTNHRFRVVTVFRRLGPDTEWATGLNTEKIAYGAHKRSTQTTLEPPKSAVRHLNAFPTSLGVDPLGMFGVKPEYRYRRRNAGRLDGLYERDDVSPAPCFGHDENARQPRGEIWPLIEVMDDQAGSPNGNAICKQHECLLRS